MIIIAINDIVNSLISKSLFRICVNTRAFDLSKKEKRSMRIQLKKNLLLNILCYNQFDP